MGLIHQISESNHSLYSQIHSVTLSKQKANLQFCLKYQISKKESDEEVSDVKYHMLENI